MQPRHLNSLPPFPVAPGGVLRWGHLPTIEARLRYWQSVRSRAVADHDPEVARTATGLWLSYEAARRELIEAERSSA
jgi:hypothetical protein